MRRHPFIIKIRAWLFVLILPLVPVANAVETPSLTGTLSTNTVRVGDRFTFDLSATLAGGDRALFPELTREPFILAWDATPIPAVTNDETRTERTRYVMSSFAIGEHRIGTNPVVIVHADGTETSLPFPDVVIDIRSVLTNPPPELADLKPPAPLPGHPWMRIAGMIALVTLAALLAALLIRRWLKRPATAPRTRVVPPHEIALTALQGLLQRGFIEKGEAEAFYVELSAIVRIYLEQRFELHAPEQTTEEFIRSSSASPQLRPDHRLLTQEFLEQSDLVKFARFSPAEADMKAAWDAAARLVRETIPTPSPQGGAS